MTDIEASPRSGKPQKRGEGRSPAYPFIPVQKALERAQELYVQESAHFAPLKSAMAAWNYSPKSSGARQTLATMRYYGLVDVTGDGDARMIRVSELARKIILDKREDDTEKRALIRHVALTPSAHKALFQEYPEGLPSDGTVHHFLVFRKEFNDAAANDLLAEFKLTASYIGLYEPDQNVDKVPQSEDTPNGENERPAVKVGDKVQATVHGVDQFADGAIVLGMSEDGQWVFTDQSNAGVALKDVTIMEGADVPGAKAPPPIPAYLAATVRKQDEMARPGTRRAVFPIDEGDVTLIFPEAISPTGLQDLSEYLAIFLKKEARQKRDGNTAAVIRDLG